MRSSELITSVSPRRSISPLLLTHRNIIKQHTFTQHKRTSHRNGPRPNHSIAMDSPTAWLCSPQHTTRILPLGRSDVFRAWTLEGGKLFNRSYRATIASCQIRLWSKIKAWQSASVWWSLGCRATCENGVGWGRALGRCTAHPS